MQLQRVGCYISLSQLPPEADVAISRCHYGFLAPANPSLPLVRDNLCLLTLILTASLPKLMYMYFPSEQLISIFITLDAESVLHPDWPMKVPAWKVRSAAASHPDLYRAVLFSL